MTRRSREVATLAMLLVIAGGGIWLTRAGAQPLSLSVVERLRAATVFIGAYDPRSDRLRASGSGFVVSPGGDIVTARHVAEGAGRLRVFLHSGQPDEQRLDATITRLDRAIRRYPLPFEAFEVGATPDGTYLFAASEQRDRVALIERSTGRTVELRLGGPPAPPARGQEPTPALELLQQSTPRRGKPAVAGE
ncbi:MAG: trypsin-like peptidase domain-containing protein [Armatimonadetes bacterium]|nr:trypsin-like peptidase domain-containing protein [Armatimonadota bacterium]